MRKDDMPKCKMGGECFARIGDKCEILTKTPKDDCSFQKPRRLYTNGVYYPFNPDSCTDANQKTIDLMKKVWVDNEIR